MPGLLAIGLEMAHQEVPLTEHDRESKALTHNTRKRQRNGHHEIAFLDPYYVCS